MIISRTKRAFELKWKTFFLVSQDLSFTHIKQTSKNVADTIFKGYSAISVFLDQSGIYVFKSVQYIFQFTSLDIHITHGGLCHLPGGNFTPRSQNGKFLKTFHFPRRVEQSHRGTETDCISICSYTCRT